MALFNLVYVSSATEPFSESELLALLERSRLNNARVEITGLLLYRDGNFIQVLEGDEAQVRETHTRISHDPRHRGLITLLAAPIEQRRYSEWAMGFRNLNSSELKSTPGYSEFLNRNWSAGQVPDQPTRALVLLEYFRKGMR